MTVTADAPRPRLEPCLLVGDDGHHAWTKLWQDPLLPFEQATPDRLAAEPIVALAPGDARYLEDCRRILQWKRDGLLPATRLAFVTYKGRSLWSPDTDGLVERWVVHARSEARQLASDRLAFIPLCLSAAKPGGDDGYIFIGGRKLRVFDVALSAVAQTGLPAIAVSDFLPPEDFAGVQMHRERIPKRDYTDYLGHSRIVLVPLQQRPISHGHMDVISGIRAGKPVVVTADASCDDYIDDGQSGVLVPENTVEAWAKAIRFAWDNADRMAAAARAKAPDYLPERYVDHVRDLIRSLG